jgi:CheY-like chemotaxis protein
MVLMVIDENNRTILIIDDNLDFHTVVTAVFRRLGYTVRSLFEGDKQQVCAIAASCDIILLDVDLPGDSGIDICKSIRSDPECASIPIILITGNTDLDRIYAQSKADACLLKPFSCGVLASQVEKLLGNAIGQNTL